MTISRFHPLSVRPSTWRTFLKGFWVSPKRYPDFAWAWLTRLLVSTGNHMVTLYLLFFLSDAVRLKETEGIDPVVWCPHSYRALRGLSHYHQRRSGAG